MHYEGRKLEELYDYSIMEKIKNTTFSPLRFLASLGAGGITVSFFALLNYTLEHGKGLITSAKAHEMATGWMLGVVSVFEVLMIVFAIIHIVLSVRYFAQLVLWRKTEEYREFVQNPLTNAGILAPFISITMTMNVFLVVVPYFIHSAAANFQSMMLPGLLAWAAIWTLLMTTEVRLLKTSFEKGFDVSKIHFGWLLHPFALGMISVTGAGIAALSADKMIASVAFFMLLISVTMGLFLFAVKLNAIFSSHFAADELPEKQFLPSLLIVVPNITLFAITFFRVGHFLEHHYEAHLGVFFMVLMTAAFAFETWYLMFGLSLLRGYFKTHMKNEFHVSQWGLVCPFVAYSVLGAFVYKVFLPHPAFLVFVISVIAFTITLFAFLLAKQIKCASRASGKLRCF